jgi:hypothetical protein
MGLADHPQQTVGRGRANHCPDGFVIETLRLHRIGRKFFNNLFTYRGEREFAIPLIPFMEGAKDEKNQPLCPSGGIAASATEGRGRENALIGLFENLDPAP